MKKNKEVILESKEKGAGFSVSPLKLFVRGSGKGNRVKPGITARVNEVKGGENWKKFGKGEGD